MTDELRSKFLLSALLQKKSSRFGEKGRVETWGSSSARTLPSSSNDTAQCGLVLDAAVIRAETERFTEAMKFFVSSTPNACPPNEIFLLP